MRDNGSNRERERRVEGKGKGETERGRCDRNIRKGRWSIKLREKLNVRVEKEEHHYWTRL